MNLAKIVDQSTVAKLLQRVVRTEEGILRISQETIYRMIEDKSSYDFNLNHLCPSNRLLKFRRCTAKEIMVVDEYILDLEKNVYMQVAERSLIDLLKSGDINNLLYVPHLDAHLANVRLESCVLLAGSFNPLHHGHIQLLDSASKTAGDNLFGVFELSISNCAKSEIGDHELYTRMAQFTVENRILLVTNKPYFRDKVNFIDSQSWFCIGADTYRRFFDVQFYESQKQLLDFTDFLIQRGVKLVVGPRIGVKKVEGVDDFFDKVPEQYRSSVKEVENFRVDISSTEIRNSKLLV